MGFVSLSGKASLVSISAAILLLQSWHVYFPLEFEFRGKSCVKWEHVGENGISCLLPCILLLYIEWIWTNFFKLSWNFVGAIRRTTTNCRVSFIHLYLVFPRNFGMIFLPLTNTVILLEPNCGTITEPGLPVVVPLWLVYHIPCWWVSIQSIVGIISGGTVLSVVYCGRDQLLCSLIGGIPASGISNPLSLLMLSGWSLIWILSLTL